VHLYDPMSELAQFRGEIPTELRFGRGVFDDTARLCRGLGRRALSVTGRRAMERLGYARRLCADLKGEGIDVARFSGVPPCPTTDDVDHGAALCRDFKADFVIALGGGSVIDCAKAIAAVAPGRSPAAHYLYRRASPGEDTLPIVAIPTTSGTGSELNRSAIITDPEARFKDGIRSDRLFPRLAIVDPALTCSLDRSQTAQTGFDALSHAVESYVSPKARPDTDRLALEAIRLVCRYLPAALADPGNVDAREKLALASTTMGINLTCVGTCLPHRADKALCALHPEIPHGQSVALFYCQWISFSHRGNVRRFAHVAEIMSPDTPSASTEARASGLSAVVGEFLGRIGLSRSPADFGVTDEEVPDLVRRVAGDLTVNPVPIQREVLPELFSRVLRYSEALR
jgi:alcohol dehydrogenase class IV